MPASSLIEAGAGAAGQDTGAGAGARTRAGAGRATPGRRALLQTALAGLAGLPGLATLAGLASLSACTGGPAWRVTGQGTPAAPAVVVQALAPTGTLRIAAYPGSPTSLVRGQAPGDERGVTVEVGRELARRLGVPAQLLVLERPAEVAEALKAGRADFTITNASPARAKDIQFTAPVLHLASGYLAGPGTRLASLAQVDAPGVRVGVTAGSSSQAALSRDLKAAQVLPLASVIVAAEQLRQGQIDAFASNKGILFDMADRVPGSRVLDGHWGLEQLAVGVPQGRGEAATAWLNAFAADTAVQALVKQAAQGAGLRGLAAAPR